MFNGKNKAVTFSFDDGVTQDIRFIEILNKYGLKCTFNLNSERFEKERILKIDGVDINHNIVKKNDVKHIYEGHEIAVHTLTHPLLPTLEDDKEIIRQVEQDRINLSEIAGYEVIGMAYPGGGINNDDRVAEIIKNNTGVKYSRTIKSTHNFNLQDNLYRFNPSIHVVSSWDESMEKAEEFISLNTDSPKIFYIWGHSYEFDVDPTYWDRIDEFCRLISGKEDIFYGTNSEILLK